MIGVSVGDENAVDGFRLFRGGAAKPGRQVTREKLVVTAVDQDDLSIRSFDNAAVALLNVDEVYLEDLILFPRYDDLGRFDARRFCRFDKSGSRGRDQAAVGTCFKAGDLDFQVSAFLLGDRDLIAP